jgi:hypothetical protein
MSDDAQYEEMKQKIVAYLGSLEGKGADTTINIGKNVGLKRRDAMKIIRQMEVDGIVESTGVTAGVAGYKLKK